MTGASFFDTIYSMQAIYQIKNKINGKIYIGSTNDIYRRWINHRSKLNNGIHENSYLQASWKKHGEVSFEFTIIEEVDDSNRIEREIHYLNKTKCYERDIGYNLDKNPSDKSGENNPFYGRTHTDKVKARLREVAENRSEELKRKMGEKNIGELSGRAKLTWIKVRKIREEYNTGTTSYPKLAKKYKVATSTIQAIIEKKSWKE